MQIVSCCNLSALYPVRNARITQAYVIPPVKSFDSLFFLSCFMCGCKGLAANPEMCG